MLFRSFSYNEETARWTFTPNDYFYGTVNLSYNVTDGTASTAATNTFELAYVNDAPELTDAKAVLASGSEDIEYTLSEADLLTGYTDADGDAIEVFGITSASGLISNNNDGTFTFKPNPDISGDVTLDYVVRDQFGGNTLATISFNLEAINDKPIRTGGNFSTLFFLEDQDPAPVGLQDLNYNPGGGISEADQILTYTITALPDAALGQIEIGRAHV